MDDSTTLLASLDELDKAKVLELADVIARQGQGASKLSGELNRAGNPILE